MTSVRIATYSVDGSTKYGAVTDNGIVDLSGQFGKEYPTLREAIAWSYELLSAEEQAVLGESADVVTAAEGNEEPSDTLDDDGIAVQIDAA